MIVTIQIVSYYSIIIIIDCYGDLYVIQIAVIDFRRYY